jgi:hypothetical protein
MTNMKKADVNGDRSITLPVFLAGLGTGIVLTVLITPLSGAALRGIGRRVKDGVDWMECKAAAAKDEVLTQARGLGDRFKAVVGAVRES